MAFWRKRQQDQAKANPAIAALLLDAKAGNAARTSDPLVMIELAKIHEARSSLRVGTADLAFRSSDAALDEAVKWWKRAADAGNSDAMVRLGQVYLGWGGRAAEVADLYERAANAGNVTAMLKLGTVLHGRHQHNRGLSNLGSTAAPLEHADLEAAKSWYLKAAKAGNVQATFNLGVIAEEQGDRQQAIAWYVQASAAGNQTAVQRVSYLRGERPPGHYEIDLR